MRIYTRTGDTGETGLFGGARVPKDALRVEAFGTVDEVNCHLGAVRAQTQDPDLGALLERLQRGLFVLGADLATPLDARPGSAQRVAAEATAALEAEIDRLEDELEPLRQFILPGGPGGAAGLHVARAVCRRAERLCVALARQEPVNPEVLRHLNRLSDLLFVMARAACRRAGAPDLLWNSPGGGVGG